MWSGAVTTTAWSWFAAWVRAFMALRRAMRSNRIASTPPFADFGAPAASPANTERAAPIASAVSDLP